MLNKVADGEKPIKCEKRNRDTASNKKPRKSWNHPQTALETPKKVSQIMEKKTFTFQNQAVVMKFGLQLENN